MPQFSVNPIFLEEKIDMLNTDPGWSESGYLYALDLLGELAWLRLKVRLPAAAVVLSFPERMLQQILFAKDSPSIIRY